MQKQEIKSFATKEIVEWKSLKRFYEYFDNFLDDLQVRDSHDPAPYNKRVHYIPNRNSAECFRRIGDLTTEDKIYLENLRNPICKNIDLTPAAEKIWDLQKERDKEKEIQKKKEKQQVIDTLNAIATEQYFEKLREKKRKQAEKKARDNAAKIELEEQRRLKAMADRRKEAAQKLEQERAERMKAQALLLYEVEARKQEREKWESSPEFEAMQKHRLIERQKWRKNYEMQQAIRGKITDLDKQGMTLEEAFEWLVTEIGQ